MRKALLFLLFCSAATAQTFTTISDTIKAPDGVSNFDGTLNVAWPAYTISGISYGAGSMKVIVTNGALNISLMPTDRMTCAQTCSYTVSYTSQGQNIQAQWKVPTSASPVLLSAVFSAEPTGPVYGTTGTFSGNVSIGTTVLLNCTGPDDTVAINAKISAASNGSTLNFTSSSCTVSDELAVTSKSNFRLVANGTKITQTAANKAIFHVTSGAGVQIKGFDLYGLGTDYVNSGSGTTGADTVRITSSTGVSVEDNTLEHFGEAAVMVESSSRVLVTNNDVVGLGSGTIPSGGNGNFAVATNGAGATYGGYVITNNRIKDTAMGVFLGNDFSEVLVGHNVFNTIVGQTCVYSYSVETIVDHNTCVSVGGPNGGGVVFRLNSSSTVDGTGIKVTNNKLTGASIAFTVVSGATHKFVAPDISGNTVRNSYSPIQVTNAAVSPTYDAVDVSLKHNIIPTGSTAGYGIQAAGSGVISGNLVDGAVWSCIYSTVGTWEIANNNLNDCGNGAAGGATQQSGIFVEASTTLVRLHHNIIGLGTGGTINSLYSSTGSTIEAWDNVYPSTKAVSYNGTTNNHNSGPLYVYNVGDGSTANFENVFLWATGNVFKLQSSKGGTGTFRDVAVNVGGVGDILYGHAGSGVADIGTASFGANSPGPFTLAGTGKAQNVAFGSLGTVPAAGIFVYCTTCTTAATCAGSGTGHMAVSNGTNWTCQ